MEYHFSWDGQSTVLKVNLFYTPVAKDSTSFIYGAPEIGNQLDIFKVLGNIYAGSGDSITIDTARRRIVAWHKTIGPKQLHYEISGALLSPAKHNNANEQFRAQLVPGAFYSLSFNLFMQVDTGSYKAISYVWDKWPTAARYFSSAQPDAKPNVQITVNASQMMKIYMAMDTKLLVGKYQVHNVPYYAVTTGRDTLNNMQDNLKPFFNTFFPAITDYWMDYKDKDYFVSVLPFLNKAKPNYTGFGLVDGFSMRYNGSYDIDKKIVIAHETSHKWIGNKLQIKQKGMEYMWFEEGFDDYVQLCILAKTGMISKGDFLDYFNTKNLTPHYKSPVRTASADSIEKYFWINHDYEKLPYQRGFIFAFYFDNQVRLVSAGKKTIRDFLLTLRKRVSTNKDGQMTIDDYIETGAMFLPKAQVKEDVDKYLQGGALLDFNLVKLIDAFKVKYKNGIPILSMSKDADLPKLMSW